MMFSYTRCDPSLYQGRNNAIEVSSSAKGPASLAFWLYVLGRVPMFGFQIYNLS